MRIAEITIANFRCLREARLVCHSLTSLVGRNGAGKSTVLHALDLFYRPSSTVSRDDFFNRDTTAVIAIQVAFDNLRPDEQAEFATYLQEGRLTVTKRYELAGAAVTASGRYYAARLRYPAFQALRAMGAKDLSKALGDAFDKLVALGSVPPEPRPPKTGLAGMLAYMDQFETDHADLLELIEDEAQFFGEKNVGGGKLDTYTQFVYVPAVRDATQEATTDARKSSFGQLLDIAVIRKVNSRPAIANLQQTLLDTVGQAYCPEVLGDDLQNLEASLNKVLQPFVPNAALSLEWSGEPTVSFEPPKVVPLMTEDAFTGEISKKGHGLQRALIFTLLSHLARVKNVPAAPSAETDADAPTPPPIVARGPNLILGIEEPELYQHPNRCRHFAALLRRLSADDAAETPGTQVILTTHSPLFISLEHFEEVRLVQKQSPQDALTPGCGVISAATLESLRHAWAIACNKKDDAVTINSMLARMRSFMSSQASEGFFADTVVLVEGASDVAVLCQTAHERQVDWIARGVGVLPVGGKSNIGAPFLVFTSLKIPTYYVFDADGNLNGKGKNHGEDDAILQNHILLQLGGATPTDFPPATWSPHFACFAQQMEETLQEDAGSDFFRDTTRAIADELGWGDPAEVLKNARAAAAFVERTYKAGKSLPSIEKIIDAITALAPGPGAPPATPSAERIAASPAEAVDPEPALTPVP